MRLHLVVLLFLVPISSSAQSLEPDSFRKEFIYLGGRLIAVDTVTDQTPPPSVSVVIDSPSESSNHPNSNIPLSWTATANPLVDRCEAQIDAGPIMLYPNCNNGSVTQTQLSNVHVPDTAKLLGLDFADNAGLAAIDRSGNGLNGTLNNGVAWTTGKYGVGLNFDGVDDYVSFGDVLDLNTTDSFSFTFWIKPSAFDRYIIAKQDNFQNGRGYGIYLLSGGTIQFALIADQNTAILTASSSAAVTLGAWNHVVVTYDGSQHPTGVKFYVNGVAATTYLGADTLAGFSTITPEPLHIGCREGCTSNRYQGVMDEVAVYSRILSATEVGDIYTDSAFDGSHTFTVKAYNVGGEFATDSVAFSIGGSSNQAPVVSSVAPNSGSGLQQSFAFSFSDPNGHQDIAEAEVNFAVGNSLSNACYARFDPSSNEVELRNDANSAWSAASVLGSGNNLANSQCTIDISDSSSSGSANNLTLTLDVEFEASYEGTRPIYARVEDAAQVADGWDQIGSWIVDDGQTTFTESGGLVYMEAEAGTIINRTQTWELRTDIAGYTGTGFLRAEPNIGSDNETGYVGVSPEVVFTVNFSTTGTYYVYLRHYAGGDDSGVHVGLDGQAVATGEDIYPEIEDQWNWGINTSAGPRASLNITSAGQHTIHVWMGEDGLNFDRLVLSTDDELDPDQVGGGNQAPSVSVSVSGGPFTAPADVTLNATASDPDGTIDRVEFYRDGTIPLGTDSVAPYSYLWSGVGAGSYSITAKAFDNEELSTTSSPANVTVNPANQAPTVSVSVSGGPFTAPADVTLNATASDPDGTIDRVEFYRDGTIPLGTDSVAPYSYLWSGVGAGNYSITAKAYDDEELSTTSSPANVTVNSGGGGNQQPSVGTVTPSSGTGLQESFEFSFSDPDGYDDIAEAEVNFAVGNSLANSCYARFVRSSNAVQLRNDANSAWSAASTLETGSDLSNSQCTVHVSSSSSSGTTNTLTLTLDIEFDLGYDGSQPIYARVEDIGLSDGWDEIGSYTVASGGGTFTESGGFVQMEAEDGTPVNRTHSWVLRTDESGYSGAGYWRAEPDNGTNQGSGYVGVSPEVQFEVNFSTTGTYYVWVRGFSPDSQSETVHAGLDGQAVSAAEAIGLEPFSQWTWTNETLLGTRPTLTISTTGVHTINIWMREDGFSFDKLLLTTDSEYDANNP